MTSVGVMASSVAQLALLVEDGDNFTDAPWAVVGSPTVTASGHTGNGFSFPAAGSNQTNYNIPSGDQTATVTVGCHIKFSTLPATAGILGFRSDSGGTNHVNLRARNSGAIFVYRGPPVGTSIGTSATGLITTGVWYYLEARVTLHDTTGAVTVRLDGTPIITVTTVDTKNAGTKTVFDQIRIQGETDTAHIVDNIYIRNDATWGP